MVRNYPIGPAYKIERLVPKFGWAWGPGDWTGDDLAQAKQAFAAKQTPGNRIRLIGLNADKTAYEEIGAYHG